MSTAPITPMWVGLVLAHAAPETCERFAALDLSHMQSAHWTRVRFDWLSGLHIALGAAPTPVSAIIAGSYWPAMHDERVISILMRTCAEHLNSGESLAVAERLVMVVEYTALAAATHDRIVALGARA